MNRSNHSHRHLAAFGRSLRLFLRAEQGVAMVEFAFVFPFLFLLIFGATEMSRFLLIQQRLERAPFMLGDIVAQYAPASSKGQSGEISVDQMNNNVFPQFSRVLGTFSSKKDQAIIITSFLKSGGIKRIEWQIASGADTLAGCDQEPTPHCVHSIVNDYQPSDISPAVLGTATKFPKEIDDLLAVMPDNTNMLVTEIFYEYRPILMKQLQAVNALSDGNNSFYLSTRIYAKHAFTAPRKGQMLSLPPSFPAP